MEVKIKELKLCAIIGTMNPCSNTAYFVRRYLDRLACISEIYMEYEILCLADYSLSNCVGCYHCFKNNSCDLDDDLVFLKERFNAVDIVVWATPVYMNNVSGIMKTLLDRLHMWTKVMYMGGKRSIILTTSSHQGGEYYVHSYLSNILCNLGFLNMDSFHMTVDMPQQLYNKADEERLINQYCTETINHILSPDSTYITQLHEFVFSDLRNQVRGLIPARQNSFIIPYWEKSGMFGCDSYQEYIEEKYKTKGKDYGLQSY